MRLRVVWTLIGAASAANLALFSVDRRRDEREPLTDGEPARPADVLACFDLARPTLLGVSDSRFEGDETEQAVGETNVDSTETRALPSRYRLVLCDDPEPFTEGDTVLHRESLEQTVALLDARVDPALPECAVPRGFVRVPRYCSTILSARQCSLAKPRRYTRRESIACLDVFLANLVAIHSRLGLRDTYVNLTRAGNECLLSAVRDSPRLNATRRVMSCTGVASSSSSSSSSSSIASDENCRAERFELARFMPLRSFASVVQHVPLLLVVAIAVAQRA